MNIILEIWIGFGIVLALMIAETVYYSWQNNK